jgi:cytochrome P450
MVNEIMRSCESYDDNRTVFFRKTRLRFHDMTMSATTFPLHPIAAVTHPNPYPYYAELATRSPVFFDSQLRLWIAAGADAVTNVLSSDLCRVRPPTEPIPNALSGSAAADIFRHLVRMNDGQAHTSTKQAVAAGFASVRLAEAAAHSGHWANELANELTPAVRADNLLPFALRLPVYVVSSLWGIPPEHLPETARLTGDFMACLAPAANPEEIARGKNAAGRLLERFRALLTGPSTAAADGLLNAFAGRAKQAGDGNDEVVIANGIGFLTQSCEATAGLIGNTLVTLASHANLRAQVLADFGLLAPVVREVARYDPPIQNTRRFLARRGSVAGQEMGEGDAILVVLAAANHDPAANATPAKFDLLRKDRRVFTFGIGPHACPGERLAYLIAEAAVRQLLASGIRLEELAGPIHYRASVNARIPDWKKEPPQ